MPILWQVESLPEKLWTSVSVNKKISIWGFEPNPALQHNQYKWISQYWNGPKSNEYIMLFQRKNKYAQCIIFYFEIWLIIVAGFESNSFS